MAITVVPGSVSMLVTHRPKVAAPAVNGANMIFTCSQDLRVTGKCKITGAAGDNPVGWTLGLIQMQWIETNWGFYRGQTDSDGSCFLQRARPPARAVQGCRDTLVVGAIFVDNNPGLDRTVIPGPPAPFPLNMSASFFDGPNDTYPLTRVNTQTGKTNFIREVQLEFHFCTVLALMDPANNLQQLKHVLWNVHWQAQFLPTNFANLAAPWNITLTGGPLGNTQNVTAALDGAPADHRFAGLVTAALAPNCNVLATAAANAPNTKESRKWEFFDVRR